MRVLITGVTGFAGSHLAECLAADGRFQVYGIHRTRSGMQNIRHLLDRIHLLECDLRDPSSVERVMAEVRPQWVFHLAAQSFVPTSWTAPYETFDTNVLGQLNLFEAIRKLRLPCRVQVACSSEEYGLVHPDEVPIREEQPLRPLSPYAVSKIAQDYLAYQYHQSYGLDVVRTRAFNHAGPRQGEPFVISNFAKQIAEMERGLRPPVLHVGNLEAKRDFTDVRDIVRAYRLALEHGAPGAVYNIASGETHTIASILERLVAMSRVRVEVREDPARLRPSDVPILLGDASRFRACTGWKPEVPLEQTLQDTLDYWRRVVASA
ncbi:MAG TPA: GDP-mannose 4,6-dehydratase [Limnochordales bacterium]